ncbi:uncharacterized protein LOC121833919 [Ixodes scapularis]|uniref:uncharacterized protein LOC121833919 n=1 Tax=Ixodes scapularis TaxID=6945 RepID=UPI001A9E9D9C|nr:uncharacterized protein LOC121833919 [Ixodes scapularis]
MRCTAGESTVARVYALLPGKTFSIYEELFQAILDTCEANGYAPYPEIIISDYEMAAIRASKAVFGEDVTTKGCFFHLCQSTHRKVRELGLISRYKTDDRFKKMCGMLDGLAFLPPDLVPVGLDYIRGQAPTDLDDLIDYFDATYVNGTFRAVSSRVADGALTTTMRRRLSKLNITNFAQPLVPHQNSYTSTFCPFTRAKEALVARQRKLVAQVIIDVNFC